MGCFGDVRLWGDKLRNKQINFHYLTAGIELCCSKPSSCSSAFLLLKCLAFILNKQTAKKKLKTQHTILLLRACLLNSSLPALVEGNWQPFISFVAVYWDQK